MEYRNRRKIAKQHRDRIIAGGESVEMKRPTEFERSWSARMPPYAGTSLCPDKKMKKEE